MLAVSQRMTTSYSQYIYKTHNVHSSIHRTIIFVQPSAVLSMWQDRVENATGLRRSQCKERASSLVSQNTFDHDAWLERSLATVAAC
jgi:hypothetical protein